MLARKFCLSRSDRLKFDRDSESDRGNFFKIYSRANNLNHARFAVQIKKNLIKKSVDRNKLKRKIKQILESGIKKNITASNRDYLILAKNNPIGLSFSQLKEIFTNELF